MNVLGVPVTPKGAGYDYDPYDTPGEHAEIFQFRGKVYWDGAFSTYREIHISIRGFYAGLRCGTFEDLPVAPPLWQDEGQYYEGVAAIAYDLKRGSAGFIGSVVVLLLAYMNFKS